MIAVIMLSVYTALGTRQIERLTPHEVATPCREDERRAPESGNIEC